MRHVAVPVGGAFPDAHRGKMRRLQRCDMPLVDTVVRNAVEPDLSIRPRLHASPLDAVVEIFRLAWREMVDEAWRASGPARVDAHAGIIVRHPFFRIDHLPALIEIPRTRSDVRMLLRHTLTGARIDILTGESLRIGTVDEDHKLLGGLYRL